MTKKRLVRSALLDVMTRTHDIGDIPGFDPDEFLTIRELTARDVKDVTDARKDKDDAIWLSAFYVVRSIVDETGELILTDDDADELYGKLGYSALNHITQSILTFNGLTDDDDDKGKGKGKSKSPNA